MYFTVNFIVAAVALIEVAAVFRWLRKRKRLENVAGQNESEENCELEKKQQRLKPMTFVLFIVIFLATAVMLIASGVGTIFTMFQDKRVFGKTLAEPGQP